MASIKQRGAVWSYTVALPNDPKTGKRQRLTKSGFRTKKEAQLAAAQVEREVADNTFTRESDLPFHAFADEWLRLYGLEAKISSVRIRRNQTEKIKKQFAALRLRQITKKMYQELIIELHESGLSDGSVEGVHTCARMIFKKALELDLLKVDPTDFAKLPKTKKTVEDLERAEAPVKYMERDQLRTFLAEAKRSGDWNAYPLLLLLAYSGLRVGELCALKWRDIDFEAHTVSVTKTYYNPTLQATAYTLLPPKTKTSVRTIDLDPTVVAELAKLKTKHKELRLATGALYHDMDFVAAKQGFSAGAPETPKNILAKMRRALKIAGLDTTLSPHSLRHTHTSLLAEAGVGLVEIMDRLGHKDDDTTKHVYLHCTKTVKKSVAEKFSAFIGSI